MRNIACCSAIEWQIDDDLLKAHYCVIQLIWVGWKRWVNYKLLNGAVSYNSRIWLSNRYSSFSSHCRVMGIRMAQLLVISDIACQWREYVREPSSRLCPLRHQSQLLCLCNLNFSKTTTKCLYDNLTAPIVLKVIVRMVNVLHFSAAFLQLLYSYDSFTNSNLLLSSNFPVALVLVLSCIENLICCSLCFSAVVNVLQRNHSFQIWIKWTMTIKRLMHRLNIFK